MSAARRGVSASVGPRSSRLPLAEKLERYSTPEPNTGCVLWLGHLCHGYGQVRDGKRLRLAHRAAYELANGPIPEGQFLDHLCRQTACINPRHLEPVTNAENIRRGKLGVLKTTCAQGHPYTPENVGKGPKGHRYCKICHSAVMAAYYEKNAEAIRARRKKYRDEIREGKRPAPPSNATRAMRRLEARLRLAAPEVAS